MSCSLSKPSGIGVAIAGTNLSFEEFFAINLMKVTAAAI